MVIEKQPFRKYNLDSEKPGKDAFTIWLNEDERKMLEYCKIHIQQPKDSTAFKQMAYIGYLKLIGDTSFRWALGRVVKNSYNNRKLGIGMETPNPAESNEKPGQNLTE